MAAARLLETLLAQQPGPIASVSGARSVRSASPLVATYIDLILFLIHCIPSSPCRGGGSMLSSEPEVMLLAPECFQPKSASNLFHCQAISSLGCHAKDEIQSQVCHSLLTGMVAMIGVLLQQTRQDNLHGCEVEEATSVTEAAKAAASSQAKPEEYPVPRVISLSLNFFFFRCKRFLAVLCMVHFKVLTD